MNGGLAFADQCHNSYQRPIHRTACRLQIVDGIYAIQWGSHPPPKRELLRWCQVLVPSSSTDTTSKPSTHDLLLTSHARLVKILHDWVSSRYASPSLTSLEHKRIASSSNASLDVWREDFDAHRLERGMSREVDLFWLYAKICVNGYVVKGLWEPQDVNVRNAYRDLTVEVAMRLLETCTEYPRGVLVNFPNCYFQVSLNERVGEERLGTLAEICDLDDHLGGDGIDRGDQRDARTRSERCRMLDHPCRWSVHLF